MKMMKTCKIKNCERAADRYKDLCNAHYHRAYRASKGIKVRKTNDVPISGVVKCKIKNCSRKHCAFGLCDAHYQRIYKSGKVKANKPIEKRLKDVKCKAFECSRKAKSREWCTMHYKLALRRERKEKLVRLFGNACVDCEISFHPAVYQFHHRIARYKKFEIGPALTNKSWTIITKEAKKCDLLCPTCHAIRHALLRDEELGYVISKN